MGTFHNATLGSGNHAITANPNASGTGYTDTAERDADTDFNTDTDNIDKIVRVESPLGLSWLSASGTYQDLLLSGVFAWTDLGDTPGSISAGLVVQGNAGGTALEFGQALDTTDSPTFDDITINGNVIGNLLVAGQMVIGAASSPQTDVSLELADATKAFLANQGTEVQRDAITPIEGMEYYNLTANDKEFYNGTAWQSMGGGDVVGPTGAILNSIAFFDTTTGKSLDDFTNLTTDGSHLIFADNTEARWGTGEDLIIGHDAQDSNIISITGDLLFDNENATGDIVFTLGSDTNSTEVRFRNNSEADIMTVRGNSVVNLAESAILAFGGGNQFQMVYNGTDTILTNGSASGDFLLRNANVTGATTVRLGTSDTATSFNITDISNTNLFRVFGDGSALFLDNGSLSFGTGSDLTLTHDGSSSSITNTTGSLTIENTASSATTVVKLGSTDSNTGLKIRDSANTRIMDFDGDGIITVQNNRVLRFGTSFEFSISHDGTDTNILTVFGDTLFHNSNTTGDTVFKLGTDTATTSFLVQNDSEVTILDVTGDSKVFMPDNVTLALGTDDDFTVSHDGTNTDIVSSEGDLIIDNQDNTGSTIFILGTDTNATDLRVRNNSLATMFSVFGSGVVKLQDSITLALGDGNDFTMIHNGTNTFLTNSVGALLITNNAATSQITNKLGSTDNLTDFRITDSADAIIFQAFGDGALEASNNRSFSILASTEHEITTAAEFDALASGGVITLTANTTFYLKANISTSTEIVLGGFNCHFGFGGNSRTLNYTGSGDFISGTGQVNCGRSNTFQSFTGGTFINLDVGSGSDGLIMSQCNLIGWSELGTITSAGDGGLFVVDQSAFVIWTTGFTLTNLNTLTFTTSLSTLGSSTLSLINIVNTLELTQITTIDRIEHQTSGSGTLMNVDAAIPSGSQVAVIKSLSTGGGGIFDTSGSTGTFTVVADAPASGSVTAVADNGSGKARFTTSVAHGLFTDQAVTHTGMSDSDYNVTNFIAVITTTTYDMETVDFTATDSGSFDTDSVTLTDTGTTLSDGDTIAIETDDATDYDNGYTVFNQLTNTFQINAVFTATATGTWDSGGLDQTDPRVVTFNMQQSANSAYIGSWNFNGAADTTSISSGAYVDIDMENLTESSNNERFKVIDDTNGELEYTGHEPISVTLLATLHSESAPSEADYRISFSLNAATPVFATASYMPLSLKDVGDGVTVIFPLDLVTGDTIKLQIAGDGTSQNVAIAHGQLSIQ